MKKNEKNISHLWNNVRVPYICVIRDSGKGGTEKKYLKKNTAETFPDLMETQQIQETQ